MEDGPPSYRSLATNAGLGVARHVNRTTGGFRYNSGMFATRRFPLNNALVAKTGVAARAISTKTTTIKG